MSHTIETRLLRINEVAAEAGLTTRAIRYYEEIGLLEPAARSGGDYRLYDASDLERLLFIRSLRDDAGFSLAQIPSSSRTRRPRTQPRALPRDGDPAEGAPSWLTPHPRRPAIEILETKAARLATMIDEARARRRHLDEHLAEVDGGPSAGATCQARPMIGRRTPAPPRRVSRRSWRSSIGTIDSSSRPAGLLIGTWMQQVAQAWLVLQLTGDPIWLGIVATAQFLPVMVLGLFAGVVADALQNASSCSPQVAMMASRRPGGPRHHGDRRGLMIVLLAFLLDRQRRRHAGPPVVRGRARRPGACGNAVALNSAMFNGARIVGPAAAGLAIGAFGWAAFLLNGLPGRDRRPLVDRRRWPSRRGSTGQPPREPSSGTWARVLRTSDRPRWCCWRWWSSGSPRPSA
jgi:DNA-binding transcriptional MerR regulator